LQKHRKTLLDHCGVLRTIMVRCGALRKRCGSLADHWNASKPLRFTTRHCSASSTRCGGVHHTRNSLHTDIVEHDVDVALVAESWFTAKHCDENIEIDQ